MKRYFPALLFALLSMASCGHKGTPREADSAALDSVPEAPVTVIQLPDTAYESVSLIKPVTRVLDTVTPGKIGPYTDLYRSAPGVLAFRGNLYRDGDMGGRVKGRPSEIAVDWEFVTAFDGRQSGSSQGWGGGSGWTGQPVYIEWPDSLIKKYKAAGTLASDFSGKEIIVGSLSSNLYFIDYETGKASRAPVYVSNPIKGSVSLDPTLNGNVYVGHGIPNERPFGAITVNLDSHSVSHVFPEDRSAPRQWGAYDSNSVRVGNFVFRPGENGVLYKFDVSSGTPRLHSSMSYTARGAGPGIEASISIYGNYGYTADNHGYIVCTNLDTMKPVWVYFIGDDTDSTPMVSVEDGVPYVYTGSEQDRGANGTVRYVKLNGLNGKPVWEKEVAAKRFDYEKKHFDGGFYASTLNGLGNCSDLLFVNCVKNLSGQNGTFMAIDRKTGETVYELPLKRYAWSSPVGFLNENNEMYVLTADCSGNMYLIDGRKGEIITVKAVGANFESSPVVAGNTAVVGSRGQTIYRVSLR